MYLNRTAGLTFIFMVGMMTTSSVQAVLPDKTLVYCSEASPAGFDPGQYASTVEYAANEPLYNRLLEFERGGTKFIPSLAESWDISTDGRVYTFHLRRGVTFHTTPWFKPTRDFNAEDVLFTFERMHHPEMPFRKAYPVLFPYWDFAAFDKMIEKIEAPDFHTVRFTLKSVNASFLSNIAAPPLSILSAEYAAQLLKTGKPADINWKPVGTGPFILQKYVKDASIRFKGNPDYWKPHDVQLSHLIFAITPDGAVRSQKLRKNECQVSIYPLLDDVAALQVDPTIQVLSQTGYSVGYLAYNVTHEPLDDVQVRRALDRAIDKQAIIKAVFQGHAQLAVAPMSPLQWAYNETLEDRPHDIKAAKALLAQAGYPNGFSMSLWAMPVQRPYNPNPKLMAQMIQSDWAKIGVKAKIVLYEWGEYLKRGMKGEHDAMLFGSIVDNDDPTNWFGDLICSAAASRSVTKWCYPPFESLLKQAAQTMDISKRRWFYIQAQQIFKREQPYTAIAYPIVYQPINKQVTGFKINPFGTTQFAGVGLQ